MNKPVNNSIKNWATDDRPREKLQTKGQQALSNAELLAILINNGSPQYSALQLAQQILTACDQNLVNLHKLTIADYCKVKGIGPAKAITIIAALELGKRRHLIEQAVPKANTITSIAAYVKTLLQNETVENFIVIHLNNAMGIIGNTTISKGGLTGTLVDCRLIFKAALEHNATSIIVAHNHPSGSLKPSNADINVTNIIKENGKLLDVKLLDHIIVSNAGHFSFNENNLL